MRLIDQAARFHFEQSAGPEGLSMLASILIGLDPIYHNDERMDALCCWAKPSGATLVGLGVIDEPGIRAVEPAWPVGGKSESDPLLYHGYEGRLADANRQVDLVLERFATCCRKAGISHVRVKASGMPHEMIEKEAQTCDLIVMARDARFRFFARDEVLDDTIKRVLKNAPRPILIAPEGTFPSGPSVVAYDGSLQAAHALAAFQATGLGEFGGPDVHVITMDSNTLDATRHSERALKYLAYHKITAIPHVLPSSKDPAEVILEYVRTLGASMLVMGAYGQPVLREFFIGSVTRTILKDCPVPVFCYH
jgi:nucleotide-binding universal stress UspA family protein